MNWTTITGLTLLITGVVIMGVVGCAPTAQETTNDIITNPNSTPEQVEAALKVEEARADIKNKEKMYSILAFVLGASCVCFGLSIVAVYFSRMLGGLGAAGSIATAVLALTFMSHATWIAIIGVIAMVALVGSAMYVGYRKLETAEEGEYVSNKAFKQVVDTMQATKRTDWGENTRKLADDIQDEETKTMVKAHKKG